MNPLDEGTGAIADPDNGDLDLVHRSFAPNAR
jgi:hypothetical protein